ncbi:MAG: homocysteine S-methyltransferase family protein [Sandaracinaceae bacterium]
MRAPIAILDGPMGTELDRRGVPTPLPWWSAGANLAAPEVVAAIHRDYAAAGATLHTANTFRTKRRTVGARWAELASSAVSIARASVPASHRVLGSIAPLEDCYRPDLSPAQDDPTTTRREHRELAQHLARAGVDVLLCETFPHSGEALLAVEEAVATGCETWLALCPGPDGTLLSPGALGACAEEAVRRGARAVCVNCVGAPHALAFVEALGVIGSRHGVPVGVYANAGHADDAVGWKALDEAPERAAERYLAHARRWYEAGATIVGGCCGTGVPHVAAIASALAGPVGRQPS